MVGTPVFLGFSMARRGSRRRLVVVTYAILLALMAVMIVVSRLAPRWPVAGFASSFAFILAFIVVFSRIFGRLAKDMVLPLMRVGEITSLGLTSRPRRDEDGLDERELAVRNAAYFTAYRAVAVYSIIAWMALIYSLKLGASLALLLVLWLFLPLFTMIFTLPPAVILWTEPDVPEEARF
jgi:hypothetical protein